MLHSSAPSSTRPRDAVRADRRSEPRVSGLSATLLALGLLGLTACGGSPSTTCTSGSCSQTATCDGSTPAASAAASPIQLFTFGTRKVGEIVTVDVPPNTASVTFIKQAVAAPATASFSDLGTVPNAASPLRVTGPTGVVYADAFSPPTDPTHAMLFVGDETAGTGTLTFPNTSGGLQTVSTGAPAGAWRFVVSDMAYACDQASNCATGGGSSTSTYDVTAIVKPGAGTGAEIPTTGTVDVTFNLTPGGITPALSAATAAKDPDLGRLVTSLASVLGTSGVSLGVVSFVDVPASLASRVAAGVQVDDHSACGELPQLLLSAPNGRQVNIFLVPGFVATGLVPGTVVAGLDGAIPGPATVSPSVESGAAVSAADLRAGRSYCTGGVDLRCGADRVAFVTAHEMGHFFGLFHVTEQHGTAFDPLDDTATCRCQSCAADPSQCADASPAPKTPHAMSVGECSAGPTCGGGTNLMFWLAAGGTTGTLTDEQTRIIRASPAVY